MFNLKNLIGDPNKRKLDKLRPEVALINSLAPELAALSDRELQAKTGEFKQRLEQGEPLDDLLPEAFAVGGVGDITAIVFASFDWLHRVLD